MAAARSAARSAISVVSRSTAFKTFDQYTEEADLPPFELPVGPEETLLFPCPSGDALRVMGMAEAAGDFTTMINAGFGDQAPRMWELGGEKPYLVLNRILRDLMAHFGRSLADLGESSASSR
jgi:hypothetical protein